VKTKFAVVRHKGNEELNSEFIKKLSKCSDVVMLGVDTSDRRRSKVKCRSAQSSNTPRELQHKPAFFSGSISLLGMSISHSLNPSTPVARLLSMCTETHREVIKRF